MNKRGSGILLHISSLTSPFGIGDLGPGAYRFVDLIAEAGQSYWQVLPLNPTNTVYGNSPYSSFSAFAGNPILISPEIMIENGFISKSDTAGHPKFSAVRVNYRAAARYKYKILRRAYKKNRETLKQDRGFLKFCRENFFWLDDYALFISIKSHFKNIDWGNWPKELRDRKPGSMEEWEKRLKESVLMEKFFQYVFFKQWYSLKKYCEGKNIQIIGDMPIYVNFDSSDVWANPGIFNLDKRKKPVFSTGVPPDYFSSTGQLWGHPVYRWDVLRKTGYSWWIKRIEHNQRIFHMFRLDHFRGFVGYWEVRAGEKTAINGRWAGAPAMHFFTALLKRFSRIPIIAEDLGVITPDVKEVMNHFGFPGMRVLLFAFAKDISVNPYAPHNHIKNCVVYTGTHDNNTIKGWFKKETDYECRKRLFDYIGREVTGKTIHIELIRLAMMSVADMIIIPMQDVLGLGEKARMNLPASKKGNWEWRLTPKLLASPEIKELFAITRLYGRT